MEQLSNEACATTFNKGLYFLLLMIIRYYYVLVGICPMPRTVSQLNTENLWLFLVLD